MGWLQRLWQSIRGPDLADPSRPTGRLSRCDACGSKIVNPVDWHEHDARRWWVLLRCGACGNSHEVVISDAEAKLLERDLQPGLDAIARIAAKLDRERMELEVEIFTTALERDLVGPNDFAAGR